MGSLRQRKEGLKPLEIEIEKKKAVLEDEKTEIKEVDDEPLSPSALLFNEPNFNVHVIAIMGGSSRIYPDIVKQHLPHTLLKHPRFSSLQVVDEKSGEMKWVRTKVDLDKHVIVVPEVDSNILDSPDKFVEDYVYNLSKTSLDRSKPLWELHLLNVKTSDSAAIGVFRIHHSIGDGTSLMSLLLACTRQVSDPNLLPTIPTTSAKKRKNIVGNYSNKFIKLFASLWLFLQMIWNTVVDVVMFGATALFLNDTITPIKAPPGSEFSPRRLVFRTVSFNDIKFIKNALDMTVNDVALGITQAGLSRYLNRRFGEENKKNEGESEKKNNLPKNIRLRSTLLINLRPSAGIQALADMMEKNTKAQWGNWIGYVLLPFKIALKDDPLDYIRDAKATVDRKKRSFEAIYTFTIGELVLKLFGIKRASSLSHKILTNTTMCFSNLVGPQEQIGFYGHPIAYIAPGSYGQPHGLMINFQSYVDKITIVLSVDEAVVPDPCRLLDDLEDSLKLIKDAVIETKP